MRKIDDFENGAADGEAKAEDCKALEEKLRCSQERLEIILGRIDRGIWEYDVKSGLLERKDGRNPSEVPFDVENVPEALGNYEYFHKDTLPALNGFFKKIKKGDKTAAAVFKVMLKGIAHWKKAESVTVCGDDGKPASAVIIADEICVDKEDVNALRGREGATGLVAYYVVNLDRDEIVEYKYYDAAYVDEFASASFERLLNENRDKAFTPTEADAMQRAFSPKNLTQAYVDGRRRVSLECRRKDYRGKVAWIRGEMWLSRNGDNGELFGTFTLKLTEHKDSGAPAEEGSVRRDKVTGTLDEESFATAAEARIESARGRRGGGCCAVILVALDKFKAVNDAFSRTFGDYALLEAAAVIKDRLPQGAVLGRVGGGGRRGGDEFVAFLDDAGNKSDVLRTALDVCNAVKRAFRADAVRVEVSASVGVAICENADADCQKMTDMARDAMLAVKTLGGNGVRLYGEESARAAGKDEISGSVVDYIADQTELPIIVTDEGGCDTLYISPSASTYFTGIKRTSPTLRQVKFLEGIPDGVGARPTEIEVDGRASRAYCVKCEWRGRQALALMPPRKALEDSQVASRNIAELLFAANITLSEKCFADKLEALIDTSKGLFAAKDCIAAVFNCGDEGVKTPFDTEQFDFYSSTGGYLGGMEMNSAAADLVPVLTPYLAQADTAGVAYVKSVDMLSDAAAYKLLSKYGAESILLMSAKVPQGWVYIAVINPSRNCHNTEITDSIRFFFGKCAAIEGDRLRRWQSLYQDKLTGFGNRAALTEFTQKNAAGVAGLITVSINGMAGINEQFGWDYGDAVLKKAADDVKTAVTFEGTKFFRNVSDEFVVVLPEIARERFDFECSLLRKKLDDESGFTVAAGIAWTGDAAGFKKLYEQAKTAMKSEKRAFRRSADTGVDSVSDSVARTFYRNVREGNIIVYLQPRWRFGREGGEAVGAEALMRLNHPQQGHISPDKYVATLEKYNLVGALDLFMIERVCKLLAGWKKDNRRLVPIAVNCSRITLCEEGFADAVIKVLRKYKVDGEFLELEITGSENMGDFDKLRYNCDKLRFEKIKIALDNFGTDFSNFMFLTKLKFNSVVIAREIINDITDNVAGRVLIKNMVIACDELGVKVLANGVETKEQLRTLLDLGCDYIQGYVAGRPAESEAFEKLVQKD